MATYAKNTTVSVGKSKEEIEQVLRRFGASSFAYGWKNGAAIVEFATNNRRVRFNMKLPSKSEERFTHRKRYNEKVENDEATIDKLWEQECRSYWRALLILIKAKLAAVEAGITEFESEFLSHIVVPTADGGTSTAGEWIRPQLEDAYRGGGLTRLPLLTSG